MAMNRRVHAVFAVDPGGTTGVAAGYVELGYTMKETCPGGLGAMKAEEIHGDWTTQARQIAAKAKRFTFRANVENGVGLDQIHLVCEDFVLRRRQSGGATGNLTSIWVAAAMIGYLNLNSADVTWQQASQAKNFATNERMKLWGLYTPGSEHTKDAWRHWATKVSRLIDQM